MRLVVIATILTGCATSTPRPACGPDWKPLSKDRAPAETVAIDRKQSIEIEDVQIAGVDPRFASALRGELQTKPGMSLVDAPIGADLRKLWKLGVISDAQVELDGATVRFVLAARPTIRTVVRTGGDALAQARFRQLEATSFEPARIRRMADALRESYVQAGRLDARVEARQRSHATGVDVCVALDPGPRITIAKLDFPGRKAISQKALVAALPGKQSKTNRVGGVYDEAALEFGKLYLLAEYWERGYPEVAIKDPVVKRRGKRLEVAIPIVEGPVYRLGRITTSFPAPFSLSRYVKPGDIFARSKIADARTRLEEALAPYKPYTVVPLTKINREARTIDITFEAEWSWPWDALRFWLSRSR